MFIEHLDCTWLHDIHVGRATSVANNLQLILIATVILSELCASGRSSLRLLSPVDGVPVTSRGLPKQRALSLSPFPFSALTLRQALVPQWSAFVTYCVSERHISPFPRVPCCTGPWQSCVVPWPAHRSTSWSTCKVTQGHARSRKVLQEDAV